MNASYFQDSCHERIHKQEDDLKDDENRDGARVFSKVARWIADFLYLGAVRNVDPAKDVSIDLLGPRDDVKGDEGEDCLEENLR